MKILGISPEVFIASAVLIEDGEIVVASPEERFDRVKMSNGFPVRSMQYCLDEANCTLEDLDAIAIAWNPGAHLRFPNRRMIESVRWRGEMLAMIPGMLQRMDGGQHEMVGIEQTLHYDNKCDTQIMFINHHDCHAASTFYLSPFNKAAILTVDGRGERKTSTWSKGEGHTIEELQAVELPHSLGIYYSALTQFLGFTPHTDEWKVMALAALGNPDSEYGPKLRGLLTTMPQGKFEMDLSYFDHYLFDQQPTLYSAKMEELLGISRKRGEPIEQRHYDIALALQNTFEEIFSHMLHGLHELIGETNLCLAGGAAMNSVYNGKIPSATPFKNVFIPSCPDDTGVALGAALTAYHKLGGTNRVPQTHNYWGPSYTNEEIEKVFAMCKVTAEKTDDPCGLAAKLLVEGKLVAWFQGKMEFGQRALGNRSILADPRKAETKDIINAAVKFREAFRPFAPSILEENVQEFFDIPDGTDVPFMERVYLIKEEKRDEIPAVVHYDGTGRLQTVSKQTNPRYHQLISEFKKLTGTPIVLNTSFNINGEPIVCSPTDAVRCFFTTGLDVLIIGDYVLYK
ncbi:carbamoyltransferase [Pseudodesulfovibrio sp.]|nr:carbamoyltransferase [Pseudodesulfovibrio sp.]